MFGLVTKKTLDSKIAVYEDMLQKAYAFAGVQTIGGIPVYGIGSKIEPAEKYCTVDDLYSIVKKISKTCKRVPLYVYAVKDEKKHAQYKVLSRQWEKSRKGWDYMLELKEQSMEIIGDNDELQKLLDKPNDLNSKDEFFEACYAFLLLSGNRYLYKELLNGGANKGKPYAIYNMPPNFMALRIQKGFPAEITGYEMHMFGIQQFTKDQIIHSRYFNPRFDIMGTELIGLSPVQVGNKLITQSGSERDYTNQALQNAGAYGAMIAPGYTNTNDATKAIETAGKIKADFYKEIGPQWRDGTNMNAKKIAFLMGQWDYKQFGFSPADMEIIAQNKITFQKMCNIYGASDILFNNDKAATESNVKEQIKQLYTNAVLPEVHSLRDALNMGLTPLYKDKRRHIDYDITDIAELQEDVAAIVERFSKAPAFRVDDMFEALGFGKTGAEGADKILVKQGYSLLEDIVAPVEDLQITDDYGANN